MSVKVTIEFPSAEAAIAGLAKLADIKTPAVAPAAVEKAPRKPRSDAGQTRGPQGATAASAGPVAGTAGDKRAAAPVTSTAPGNAGQQPATPTATAAPAVQAPVAPKLPTAEEVQAAVEKLFGAGKNGGFDNTAAALSRFGVKRGKDLPEAQRTEFIRRAADIAEGKYAATDTWPDLT